MQLPILATFLTSIAALSSAAPLTDSRALLAPAPLGERIVYNPHITSPTSSSVWHSGSKASVTWSTSSLPAALKNSTSTLYLGYKTKGSSSEHLNWKLADGFGVAKGKVGFTVPKGLKEREDYIVVLLGDSGNASPKFTIKAK